MMRTSAGRSIAVSILAVVASLVCIIALGSSASAALGSGSHQGGDMFTGIRRASCPRQKRTSCKAITSRAEALRILGFHAGDHPKDNEVRHNFKTIVLKVHPDRPDGDAGNFQKAKEAYELLMKKASQGKPSSPRPRWAPPPVYGENPKSPSGRWSWITNLEAEDLEAAWVAAEYNPYGGEYRGPRDPLEAEHTAPAQPKAYAWGKHAPSSPGQKSASSMSVPKSTTTVELFMGALFMALILLMIGLGPSPRAYKATAGEAQEIRLPGMEFALGAAAAKAARVPLILARDFIAGAAAEVPPISALQLRANRMVSRILVALDMSQQHGPLAQSKYKSLAAVVREDHLPSVVEQLRSSSFGLLADESNVHSGRPTLQFQRSGTGQRLLLITAASHDDGMDEGLSQLQTAIEKSMPDLVVLDMSEEHWREQREEFAVWTGHDLRVDTDRLDSSTPTPI